MKRYMMCAVFALGVFMFSAPVMAQEGVITLDDTVIKGRIQKPEAFYILQHANLSYETLDVKPSFLEDLEETVEEELF